MARIFSLQTWVQNSDAYWSFQSLLVTQSSSLRRPVAFKPFDIPLPTSFSLPYAAAQSICLYPDSIAIATASVVFSCDSFKFQVPKPINGCSMPCGVSAMGCWWLRHWQRPIKAAKAMYERMVAKREPHWGRQTMSRRCLERHRCCCKWKQ